MARRDREKDLDLRLRDLPLCCIHLNIGTLLSFFLYGGDTDSGGGSIIYLLNFLVSAFVDFVSIAIGHRKWPLFCDLLWR